MFPCRDVLAGPQEREACPQGTVQGTVLMKHKPPNSWIFVIDMFRLNSESLFSKGDGSPRDVSLSGTVCVFDSDSSNANRYITGC